MKKNLTKVIEFCKGIDPFWYFFVPSVSIFSLWLLAFYPGVMTNDSISQWRDAQPFKLSDAHPYLSTVFVSIFKRLFNNPASLALFQILAVAGFFSYTFSFFWKKGVPRALILIMAFLFMFSIPVGLYNVTLWKDVPFSLALITLSFFLATKWQQKSWSKLETTLFFFLLVAAIFFRHNGFIYAMLVPLILLFATRLKLKTKFFLSVTIIILTFLLKFSIPSLIGITPSLSGGGFVYHSSVGFYVKQPRAPFTEHSSRLLESALPQEELIKAYDPVYANALVWNEKLNTGAMNQKFWEQLSFDFYHYNLAPNIGNFIGDKVAAFVTITNGLAYNHGLLIGGEKNVYTKGVNEANEVNVKTNPVSVTLNAFLGKLLFDVEVNAFSHNVLYKMIIWNAFVPIFMLAVLLIDSFYRKKRHFQIFAIMLLVQFPLLFIFNTSGDWRYFYFFYLSFFISPLLYLWKPQEETEKNI